ncbi:hypothetical protein GQX73_g10652 [Xylaria multiplex]|uniref:Uncharacterized protein n=1 Tax=Xylaria multiplex TaxID=323545 RepID=A0A7C8IJY7_9PEZI|nr:hypothetical protein GQX73_g10652 [Xylaria multiplex]
MPTAVSKASDKTWFYHIYSIWLFTRSDLKSIVFPQTIFGVLTALALDTDEDGFLLWGRVLPRIPSVMFWVWINLLPLDIDNQRQPASVIEDKHNKPWRPIPSRRMTEAQAKIIMLGFYSLAICASFQVGGLKQSLVLIILGYGYNDLHLADWHWTSRNAMNALGFYGFASGALDVALRGLELDMNRDMTWWLVITTAVVFSTVQTQDMADQAGDRLRGRASFPLVMGDGCARWLTALPVAAWSIFCPLFWKTGTSPTVLIGAIGMVVSCSLLVCREVEADKRTFRLWTIWMAGLYVLPLWGAVESGGIDAGYAAVAPELPSSGSTPPTPDFVMHSFSGMTGGTALEGLDKDTCLAKGLKGGVVRLIYIVAFLVPEGFQHSPRGSRDHMVPEMKTDLEKGTVTMIPEDVKDMFYQDLDDETVAELAKDLRPQSIGAFWSTTKHAAWRIIPTI